jgi:flagellar biosynthesis protein FlhA
VFGLAAICIPEEEREKAQMMGYTVVDAVTVLVTHLSEVLQRHSYELLTRQDVHDLLQEIGKENPKVVEELVPNPLPLSSVHRVLQTLLEERVSIRDLLTILETLGDHAQTTRDPEVLTEYARHSLARQISREHKNEDGTLPAIVMAPQWEEKISHTLVTTEQGSFSALEPNEVQHLVREVSKSMEEVSQRGQVPVLLTTPELRRHVRRLLSRFLPGLSILSYNEISPDTRILAMNR